MPTPAIGPRHAPHTPGPLSPQLMQQERMCNIQKQRSVLTRSELQALPDATAMYKGIGRA